MANARLLAVLVVGFFASGTIAASQEICDIKFCLYFRDGTNKTISITKAQEFLPYMNLDEATLIHFPGYMEYLDLAQVKALMNGYLHGTNFNVLACDYACVSQRGYISAVVLLDDVATAVVKSITNMVAGGMDQTKLILSGMSLGSQLSGYIGRKLSFKPAKIIAGDPAGPLFNFVSPSISASDAECVICIHCDQGFYGNAQACNHTDFYPNGGVRLQPGCSVSSAEPSCSHGRCEEYMAEAARHSNDFIGVKCNSWDGFKAGKCDNNVTVPMGLTTPCSATGKFYLQTNSASPYGKGSAGIVYHS